MNIKSEAKDIKMFVDKETGEFYLIALKEGATLTGYISNPQFTYNNVPHPYKSLYAGELKVTGIKTFEISSANNKINTIFNNNSGEAVMDKSIKTTLFPDNDELFAQYHYGEGLHFGYFDPDKFMVEGSNPEAKPPKTLHKRQKKKWFTERDYFIAYMLENKDTEKTQPKGSEDETAETLQQKEFPVSDKETSRTDPIITPPPKVPDNEGTDIPENEKEDRPDTPVKVLQAREMEIGAKNTYCKLLSHPDGFIAACNWKDDNWSVCSTPPDMDGRTLYLIFTGERQAQRALVELRKNPYYEKLLVDFKTHKLNVLKQEFWDVGAVHIKDVYTYLEGLNAVLLKG